MDLPEALKRNMLANRREPLEATRSFLRSYCADADSLEELREDLVRMTSLNAATLRGYLEALEAVLSDTLPEGTLARLVGWDANWVLDDPSDVGARAWLRGIAKMIEEVLAEAGPK
jgi:hypothetical protein